MKWSEVKCSAVKGLNLSVPWRVFMVGKWCEVKWTEGPVKIGVIYLWSNNIRNYVLYFLRILLLFLCALLLTVIGLLCIVLSSCVYLYYLMFIVLLCVYFCLTYFSCWLEVSIRKVLQPATTALVFLVFPMSISEWWGGSQDSKLLLHASYIVHPT